MKRGWILIAFATSVSILFSFATVLAQQEFDLNEGPKDIFPGPLSILYENCSVSVLNQTVFPNFDGAFLLSNVPADGSLVKVRVTCPRGDGTTMFGESSLISPVANNQTSIGNLVLGQGIPPILNSLTLTPSKPSLTGLGDTAQLTVTGTFDDGTTADVTGEPDTVYTTSNPNIATVDGTGLVTAVSSGTVVLSASKDGVLSTLIMTVSTGTAGDSDGDGIPDDYETANGLNPNDPFDADLDPDGDGLTNLQEFQTGTDPNVADTDGDGISDGVEVAGTNGFVTNPLLADTDGDGIRDLLEIQTGTDPTDPNSYNLAQALSSISVNPFSFTLTVNTILAQEVSKQLSVTGNLIDGTTIDLTSTSKGTFYNSSDLLICNFGSTDGEVFAGQDGLCTVTVSNSGFSDTASVTVTSFAPIPLGFVSIPDLAYNVDIKEDYAYVASGSAGLQVVDVSDKTSPTIVASLTTATAAFDVKVVGNEAYIANGGGGLWIVDISNPTIPATLGSAPTVGGAFDVVVSGMRAFVVDATGGLQIFDVTDPTNPFLLGAVVTPGTGRGVDVSGNYVVVADGTTGVQIIDITSLTNPQIVGSVDTPGNAQDVVISGNVAFIADHTGSLQIIDFSDPANPTIIAFTDQSVSGTL